MRIAIDLHYLPTLEFFSAILDAEELIYCPNDLYQRQSFLNRTKIRLANKVESLSVPIQGRRPRIPISKVKVDFSQNWQAIHLRSIQSGYGKAPFFEYFYPYFEAVISEKKEFLWEYSAELLTICLRILRLPVRIVEGYPKIIQEDIVDIRGLIEPKTHFSTRQYYFPEPYSQVFGLDFDPNLSILDLLFCAGPEAGLILRKSQKKSEQ